MEKVVEKTVVREAGVEVSPSIESTNTPPTTFQTVQNSIYLFFAALDIILLFRLVLKLLGASHSSDFVVFVYNLSGIFVAPFQGIFHAATSEGIETTSILEPATVVALIVYSILAWGIVELARVILATKKETEE